jgi:hypothetical protein
MTGSPMYDRDQLQPEDTLVPEPSGDVLDRGYEPPDSVRGHGLGASVAEQAEGETIEQRLAQEEPEDPDLPGQPLEDAPAAAASADALLDEALVADEEPGQSDVMAERGGPVLDATPEQDAIHVIEADETP